MEVPILLASETPENWEASRAVLGESELALEVTTRGDGSKEKRLMVGDGRPAGPNHGRLLATEGIIAGLDERLAGMERTLGEAANVLEEKVGKSEVGAAGGVAELDNGGRIYPCRMPEGFVGNEGYRQGPFRINGPFEGESNNGDKIAFEGYIDFVQIGNYTMSYQFYLEFAGWEDESDDPLSFEEDAYYQLALLAGDPASNPFLFGHENNRMLEIIKGGMIAPWDGVFYGGPSGTCRIISPNAGAGTVLETSGSSASCKLTWHPECGNDWINAHAVGTRLWVSSPKAREEIGAVVGGGLIIDNNNF